MSRFDVQRVERLDPGNRADVYALRDRIVLDGAAAVRAAALLRLDETAAAELVVYVRDATRDPSAIVREAAFTALARAKDTGALDTAAEACALERGFRVRRMALLYAARACGARARQLLESAATDPFWRVRIAAHRAAATLGLSLGAQVADASPRLTGDAAIDDDDPAVVTARLLRAGNDVDPGVLVGLLAHPHQPLRRLAIRQIAARADLHLLHSVAAYLSDDRVPYAPAAAEATLARSLGVGEALAADLTSARAEPPSGVLAWAIAHAVPAPPWSHLVNWCNHGDVRVRRAAVVRLPESSPARDALLQAMAERLRDADDETRTRAAAWLLATSARDAQALLRQLSPNQQPTALRGLLVELATSAGDETTLRQLSTDPHGWVRASALGALVARNWLTRADRTGLLDDPDPWVRAAMMGKDAAVAGTCDSSPVVRQAALEQLTGTPELIGWATSHGPDEPEPQLRALAVKELFGATEPAATTALLRFSRDQDPGVRSAAVAALDGRAERVATLLNEAALTVNERIAAHTLLRLAELQAPSQDPDPAVQAHIALLDATSSGRAPQAEPAAPRARIPRPCETRQLGRTGILVNPLGISGGRGLRFDDFALAQDRGVNLFFWEPGHRELTRFLGSPRGEQAIVVAGTYHADRESIERDLRRTLKALKRTRIDVFLAFWTRSSARLAEVAPVLGALSARGIIRAAGVSTHHRDLAREAADRELDVVMVRHNAAHRGAEAEVFAHCTARGTGILTFSNLCYGRMLQRTPVQLSAPVLAPDCYRYSLSQPGVVACIAAPRRRSELEENLEVVDRPTLSAERQRELRQHGDHVYERSKSWNVSVRGGRPAPRGENLEDWIESPDSISPSL